jgi:hypothetical protein
LFIIRFTNDANRRLTYCLAIEGEYPAHDIRVNTQYLERLNSIHKEVAGKYA